MSPAFVLAFLGIVVGLPVVLGIGGSAFKHWLDHKQAMAAARVADAGRSGADNTRLEQRVAVLERILTDRSSQLGDEIEALRTQPMNRTLTQDIHP